MEGAMVKIKNFLLWKGGEKSLSAKEKWLLLFLSGILLAVIIFPFENNKSEQTGLLAESMGQGAMWSNEESDGKYGLCEEVMNVKKYEADLSKSLETSLSQMDGVGEVEAWVTLSAGEEKVLYQEKASDVTKLQEADSVGGTRLEESEKIQNEVLLDKSGNPYIIQILQPQVEGVLVVAEGADNGTVKKNITEAVQVLFGIESHRIKVAKKKVEE
jgi:stage III sporulation protein AG